MFSALHKKSSLFTLCDKVICWQYFIKNAFNIKVMTHESLLLLTFFPQNLNFYHIMTLRGYLCLALEICRMADILLRYLMIES